MIYANKETRKVNAFIDVAIPPARDLYAKYGKRLGRGEYAYDKQGGVPLCTSSATIAQMQSAQSQLDYEAKKAVEQ